MVAVLTLLAGLALGPKDEPVATPVGGDSVADQSPSGTSPAESRSEAHAARFNDPVPSDSVAGQSPPKPASVELAPLKTTPSPPRPAQARVAPARLAPAKPPGGPEDNELRDGDDLNPKRMGQFVMALCRDLDGNLWAGTEDTGVWRYSPAAEEGKRWAQFTRASTGGAPEPYGPTVTAYTPDEFVLGDDNGYALACDKLGRIWAGHLNHGVSVFNGDCPNFRSTKMGLSPSGWRNYDVLTGPLGERVFSIKTCPVDGDVWIATCAGLASYHLDNDSWSYYTRADGLPSDNIQCLAFDKNGTLYAGTQCDGLAICAPARVDGRLEYANWRVAAAPSAFQDRPPLAATGEGLPSNLTNDVLVAGDGAVYVATITGLATSRDGGRTWRFFRGADWEEKARGLYEPPPKELLKAASDAARGRTPLLEDYVTCLAEDEAGNVWLGHREKSFEAIEPHSGRRIAGSTPAAAAPDYATQLLSDASGLFVGTYGTGIARVSGVAPERRVGQAQRSPTNAVGDGSHKTGGTRSTRPTLRSAPVTNLPTPAMPPSVEGLEKLIASLQRPTKLSVTTCFLADDWTTRGDWVGRYGRQHNVLCGVSSPLDHAFNFDNLHTIAAQIDPRDVAKGESLRAWLHWLETRNQRTLYDPVPGVRRQAEWDDHGEAYPAARAGPDIFVQIKVPEGVQRVSAYFINDDGHTERSRSRDYRLRICRHRAAGAGEQLCSARVRNFWAGAYKQFVVTGPETYVLHIERGGSENTIVSGIFIDKLAGPHTMYDDQPMAWLGLIQYRAPVAPPSGAGDGALVQRARALWDAAGAAKAFPARAPFCRLCQLFAYRSAASAGAKAVLLQNWRWSLGLWTVDDREEFLRTMDEGWKQQSQQTPVMATLKRPRTMLPQAAH